MAVPLLSISQARARVLGAVHRLPSERVEIFDALDRVLVGDLIALGDVPPFACSAMDGYAIDPGPAGRTLRIVGESRAGAPSEHRLCQGEAVRISTGAAVPSGALAVIRQEDVDDQGDVIRTRTPTTRGENVRDAAEDLAAGMAALRAGATLGVAELGVATATGAGHLIVARRPHVVVLCTGDELRTPGKDLGPGQIHNSNALTLVALAARCGATVEPAEHVPDDRAATEARIAAALSRADMVVVSGGVSVGPHDHVKPAMSALGVDEIFWGVAMQPGKPTWFGTRSRQLVFGLPGTPVSAVITFALFAAPALSALQGATWRSGEDQPGTEAELGAPVSLDPRRERALHVRLTRHDGRTVAFPNAPPGSHLISSLLGADAIALIPAGDGELPVSTRVRLERLPG